MNIKPLHKMQSDVLGTGETLNAKEMLSLEMLTSFEKYTKAMFKAQYRRSFIVAEHHSQIFKALQDVVDGNCNRLIINMPPRYGKCLHPDTRVLTSQGVKTLREVKAGDTLLSFNNGKATYQKCLGTELAYKESAKVTMKSKRTIIGSLDHPMLSTIGYKEIQELSPKERIVGLKAEIPSTYEINQNELIFLTNMLFEGKCTSPAYVYANEDIQIVNEFIEACNGLNIPVKNYACSKSFEYTILGGLRGEATRLLKQADFFGHKCYTKRIPKTWFNLSLVQKYKFIDIMIAADGWVAEETGQCGVTLANEGLIDDIQLLLQTVGIVSHKSFKENNYANAWVLSIPREGTIKLLDKITFYHKRDKAIYAASKKAICHSDSFPYEIIRKEKLSYKLRYLDKTSCDPSKNITREKFEKISELNPQLKAYNFEDFYYDTIESIERVGMQELIHLEIEGTHNYIANGLVSHNTEIAIKSFISWCFALNPKCRFLHLSYSDMLVNDNSETVRNIMQENLYTTLFSKSALASDKGSAKRWKTKAGGELYAVSTQGQVTGFGAGNVDNIDEMDGGNDIFTFDDHTNEVLSLIGATSNVFQGAILIDDPMKPEDANSEVVRERINLRFENTIRNRTNSRNTPIVIIMQRLHEHDLCGYLTEIEPDEWTVLSLPAIQTKEETNESYALWPMKHTLQELERMRTLNPVVFDTQYMQDPTPKEGLMYSDGFATYTREELPAGKNAFQRWNYTDTADTGSDDLVSVCFINTEEFVYITDILCTDAPMEVTEPKTAEMLARNQTVDALIESNNGGRGFARNTKRILRTKLRNFRCAVNTFTQTQNKKTRIFTASACVQNDIKFPEGWEKKWPRFYNAIMSYRKDNKKKNQHDDAPDCLTGVWEMHSKKTRKKKIKSRN